MNNAEDLRSLAVREYQQNKFDSWPRWPLSTLGEVAQWQSTPVDTATIGVRWNEASTEQERRSAAARYRLDVGADEPIESGRFLLTDVSTTNVLALLQDPVIEDTANIDRKSGSVPRQGLWIGPLDLFPGLDTPFGSAGFLFFVLASLLVVTPIALARLSEPGTAHITPFERTKISAVVTGRIRNRDRVYSRTPCHPRPRRHRRTADPCRMVGRQRSRQTTRHGSQLATTCGDHRNCRVGGPD